MQHVSPIVSIATTAPAPNFIQSFPSDGAFEAAKGSPAANGDYYYNSVLDTIRLHSGGQWRSVELGPGVRSVSSAATVSRFDRVLLCDASGAAFTVTLYDPTTVGIVTITKTDSDYKKPVTISDGSFSTTLNTQGESVKFASDGSAWHVIGRRIPSFWTAYTPEATWVDNTSTYGHWKRAGDSGLFQLGLHVTNAPTSATLRMKLPSGMEIDTARLLFQSSNEQTTKLGEGSIRDAGASTYAAAVMYFDTTTVTLQLVTVSTLIVDLNSVVNEATPMTWANGDSLVASFCVPILGWNG